MIPTCAVRMRDLVVTILCHLTRWEVGLGAVPLSPAAPCVGLGAAPLSPAAPCGARLDGATTRGRQEHQKPQNNNNWHDYHLQSSAPGLRGGKAEAATDDVITACISLNQTPPQANRLHRCFALPMVAPPLALPPLAALPALPRHPQLHYPTHVGTVNVCLGFPRRSSVIQCTWGL